MRFYPIVREVLFLLEVEFARTLVLKGLKLLNILHLSKYIFPKIIDKPVTIMGLRFKNPIGLAAGFDKDGDCIDGLADLGFGFIEIGTATPKPQPGNPTPRIFRLPEHKAVLNHMGFNNKGIDYVLDKVAKAKYRGIIGINIGKNANTPIENALDDYLICLRKAYPVASYVAINISSPNTKNLRQLQQGDESRKFIAALKAEQNKLHKEHGKYTPIVLKIAPDLSKEDIQQLAKLLLEFEIDGVIATNTTIDRAIIIDHPLANQDGGISGAPLTAKSTEVIRTLSNELKGMIPIIGVGGIMSAQDAQEKINAGASLVQFYTGLFYDGPKLIKDISEKLN